MTTSADFFARFALDGDDPVADPAAVVPAGRARFTVLTDRLLRLEWSPNGTFTDLGSYAFPHRRAEPPGFESREADGVTVLDTGPLVLRYRGDDSFDATNLSIELTGHPTTTWVPGTADRHNLGGARRTVDGCRGDAALEPGLGSRSGWAVYDDSTGVLFGADGWVQVRTDTAQQDWYFFGYGHDYAQAVHDYTRFGGEVPLVPRWMLGAWWSRYHAYSDAELRALVGEFREHDLPLDVLVVDMDWHLPDSWTGYTWNRELFPDPEGFLAWAHAEGLHTTFNLHPALGVQSFEAAYPQMAARLGLDPDTGETVRFRITDRAFVRAYFELLHHPMEEQGVDFWWMDWQQGRDSELAGVDPLPWLNHLHFQDLGRHREHEPDRQPVVFSRWGGLGSHRYPIGFSGDSSAAWTALRFQPRYTAAGANVAYGWWSHDIGGHFGADTPELYARWVQFGALSPILRLHSNDNPIAERRPWAFGERVLDVVREAFRLRYALIPYLYTAAASGDPLVRPMSWVAPEADAAYAARHQYLLGPDLLVAPVVHPADPQTGLATVDVWLPEGEWVERTTLETFTGPRWVRLVADLEDVPQLVRPGAILPLAGATDDSLTLSVFPGAAGSAQVYDDATASPGHPGQRAWTTVWTSSSESSCLVTVDVATASPGHPATGDDLGPRSYTVRLEGTTEPAAVTVDGADHGDWRYDAATLTTYVDVAAHARTSPLAVEVHTDGELVARGAEHDTRVREADLRRLLGGADGSEATVLGLPDDAPGRAAAVARIGGPAVQVVEHTAPDEAAATLGQVVVAGAAAGGPVTAQVVWTLDAGGSVSSTSTGALDVDRDGIVLDAPFAWDGPLVPTRWSVAVVATWQRDDGPVVLREQHDSAVLVPALPRWRVALVPSGDELPSTPPAWSALPWTTYAADPGGIDFPSLDQPYAASPRVEAAAAGDETVRAVFATTITLDGDQEVALAYACGMDEVAVTVDGVEVAPDPAGTGATGFFDNQPTLRRTESVALGDGRHDVTFTVTKDAAKPWYELYLSASVVDPRGALLMGVVT